MIWKRIKGVHQLIEYSFEKEEFKTSVGLIITFTFKPTEEFKKGQGYNAPLPDDQVEEFKEFVSSWGDTNQDDDENTQQIRPVSEQ